MEVGERKKERGRVEEREGERERFKKDKTDKQQAGSQHGLCAAHGTAGCYFYFFGNGTEHSVIYGGLMQWRMWSKRSITSCFIINRVKCCRLSWLQCNRMTVAVVMR